MKVLRRQNSAYALGILLCLLGIIALIATVWLTWPQVSFSTFLNRLWTEKLGFIPWFEFKLVYLVIVADAMLISGVIVCVLSVRWFYLPGKNVWYRCPYCHKDWRSRGDMSLVQCPHCQQQVHPIMIDKKA
ncbi:MAG: hypothetical protein ABSC91_11690 [Candidatus Bathyarchaeia archaeon]|jgi:hypothetical protein